jgi:hypothetical protein
MLRLDPAQKDGACTTSQDIRDTSVRVPVYKERGLVYKCDTDVVKGFDLGAELRALK